MPPDHHAGLLEFGRTTIDCGPLDPTTCQQRTQLVLAEGQRGDPTRRIVRLTFTDDRGSYTAEYDDGTGTSLIVD